MQASIKDRTLSQSVNQSSIIFLNISHFDSYEKIRRISSFSRSRLSNKLCPVLQLSALQLSALQLSTFTLPARKYDSLNSYFQTFQNIFAFAIILLQPQFLIDIPQITKVVIFQNCYPSSSPMNCYPGSNHY